jgi:acyl-CoA dehydrogenase
MINELDIILETASKIFSKYITHELRDDFNNNSSLMKLWTDIEEQGLTKIIVKEDFLGSALPFTSILPVIQMSAKMGVPLPFTETVICNYLFSELNLEPPTGMITFALDTQNIKITNNKISGNLLSVPYLNLTNKIILVQEIDDVKHFIFIENKNGSLKNKKNFLSEPRFDLNIKDCEILNIQKLSLDINFNHIGSIVRSAQMVGSMEKVVNLSIDYCSQRVQFGRSLSKFQAIQHQISEMAVELAASNAALSSLKITNKLMPNLDDIAILKIRTGIAAGKLIAISHQVHGAMGFTKEYELSYFTKNLNSWRNDFGNETYWQNILGKNFLEKTNLSLWEYLTN